MAETFAQVLHILGGASDVACALSCSYGAAKHMRRRGLIAPEYWEDAALACAGRGRPDITVGVLVRIHRESARPGHVPGACKPKGALPARARGVRRNGPLIPPDAVDAGNAGGTAPPPNGEQPPSAPLA